MIVVEKSRGGEGISRGILVIGKSGKIQSNGSIIAPQGSTIDDVPFIVLSLAKKNKNHF
jgi:hypothetical protein